jgi:hypothetical protein
MGDPMILARGLVKSYRTAAAEVSVLQGVDLDVAAGEMVAITGASGVGKSTLLHVLGTLDRPDAGSLEVAGEDVIALDGPRRCAFRNRTLGFVFQFHHLLPEFSALENVSMPLLIGGRPAACLSRRPAGGTWGAGWGAPRGPTTAREPSRGASSSGWRWPAPWRRRRGPCWPTSPPATSIAPPAGGSTRRCGSSSARGA